MECVEHPNLNGQSPKGPYYDNLILKIFYCYFRSWAVYFGISDFQPLEAFFFNPFLWLRNFNSLKISKLFLLYWRRCSVFERLYRIITSNLLTFYIASLVWPSTLSNFHAKKIQHKNKNIPNLSLDVISFMFWKFQIPLKHDISRFFRD